jgi:hypothetical protein
VYSDSDDSDITNPKHSGYCIGHEVTYKLCLVSKNRIRSSPTNFGVDEEGLTVAGLDHGALEICQEISARRSCFSMCLPERTPPSWGTPFLRFPCAERGDTTPPVNGILYSHHWRPVGITVLQSNAKLLTPLYRIRTAISIWQRLRALTIAVTRCAHTCPSLTATVPAGRQATPESRISPS